MICPFCQTTDNKVLDSRLTSDQEGIRRRRECIKCTRRFTTYERAEMSDIIVVKRDGRREPFSREKILKGLLRACEKRPVKTEKIERLVNTIQATLRQSDKDEIKSRKLGELIMKELCLLDDIAYIRFASVYKKFRDANQFVDTIKRLKETDAPRRVKKHEVKP